MSHGSGAPGSVDIVREVPRRTQTELVHSSGQGIAGALDPSSSGLNWECYCRRTSSLCRGTSDQSCALLGETQHDYEPAVQR